jgi:hypothetical protein
VKTPRPDRNVPIYGYDEGEDPERIRGIGWVYFRFVP